MKIVVLVLCEDHVYGGGRKSINSIQYFHPEFKVVRYGTEEINRLKKQYNCEDIRFINPFALKEVWDNENPDLLIRLGADCLVLGRLDEIINWEYDVAAALNDPDIGDRDEKNNRPDMIREIPNWEWVNADLIGIKSKGFVEKYAEFTLDYWEGRELCLMNQPYQDEMGRLMYRQYRGDCQSSLNVVFRLGGFKSRILDPWGSKLIYGNAGDFVSMNKYCAPSVKKEYGGTIHNWSFWYDIRHKDGKFWVKDKQVKVLHKGGGPAFQCDKLDLDLFHPDVREKIHKVMTNDHD